MPSQLPLAQRDPVRFQLEHVHNWACKQLVRIGQLGATGRIGAREAPGYAVGLKALALILERTAPVMKPEPGDDQRAPAVTFNLGVVVNGSGEPAGALSAGLRAGHLRLHLSSSDGPAPGPGSELAGASDSASTQPGDPPAATRPRGRTPVWGAHVGRETPPPPIPPHPNSGQ